MDGSFVLYAVGNVSVNVMQLKVTFQRD